MCQYSHVRRKLKQRGEKENDSAEYDVSEILVCLVCRCSCDTEEIHTWNSWSVYLCQRCQRSNYKIMSSSLCRENKNSAIPASNYWTRESSLHDLRNGAMYEYASHTKKKTFHLILITGGGGVNKVGVLNQSSVSVRGTRCETVTSLFTSTLDCFQSCWPARIFCLTLSTKSFYLHNLQRIGDKLQSHVVDVMKCISDPGCLRNESQEGAFSTMAFSYFLFYAVTTGSLWAHAKPGKSYLMKYKTNEK